MLIKRLNAARQVRADFLKAEAAQDVAAIEAMRCVLTALEQRSAANLPLNIGLDALARLNRAAQLSLEARNEMILAHPEMAQLPAQIGLERMAGDVGECPPIPKAMHEEGNLRLVG